MSALNPSDNNFLSKKTVIACFIVFLVVAASFLVYWIQRNEGLWDVTETIKHPVVESVLTVEKATTTEEVYAIVRSGDASACEQLGARGEAVMRELCIYNIARNRKDASMCSLLRDVKLKETCISRTVK
ncbi:MAG: hypothetical protein ABH834_01350 [Candidatus Altiarchaeota archaeon]